MTKKVKTDYTAEFKESAVSMVIRSEKSTAQIAKDLGVKESTLYTWVSKAKLAKIQSTSPTNEQMFNELKRLKKELAEVKEQRDILKKATAYFAKESL